MIKNTVIYGAGRVTSACIGFFSIIYYSNIFESNTYAIYALVLALVNIINLSAFQWLRVVFVKEFCTVNLSEKVLKIYFQFLIIITILSLILFFITENIIFLYFTLMLIACSLSEITLENLRASEKSLRYSIQYVTRQIIISLTTIFLSFYFFESSLVIGYAIGCFVSFSMGWANLRGKVQKITSSYFKIDLHLIKENFPIMVGFTTSSLMNNLDKVLVIVYLGKEIGGIYALINDLVKQSLMILLEAVNLAAFPRIVKVMNKSGSSSAVEAMKENYKLLFTVGLISVTFYITYGELIVFHLLGDAYYTGVAIIPFIALATFFRGLKVYYFDQYFILFGQKKRIYYLSLFSIITMITLYQFLLFFNDIITASIINFLVFLISTCLSWFLTKTIVEYKVPMSFSLFLIIICSMFIFFNTQLNITSNNLYNILISFTILITITIICIIYIYKGIKS